MICKQCGRNIANNKGDYSCDGCGVGLPAKVVLTTWNPNNMNVSGRTHHIICIGGGGGGSGWQNTAIGWAGGSGGSGYMTIDGGDR